MIQWIKKLLFKKDFEDLQASIDFFKSHKAESYRILDQEKFEFNTKKDKWEKEQKEEYTARLEKENLQLLQDYKDKLETLIDYRLIPGFKVWVFSHEIQGKPEQIEIESVYINKQRVSINNDMYLKYFHSEKEAVTFYNNYLEKQKITLDTTP